MSSFIVGVLAALVLADLFVNAIRYDRERRDWRR